MERRMVPYYLGVDQVIRDDLNSNGWRRRHMIHKGKMVDVDALMMSLPKAAKRVYPVAWMGEDGTGHLYIVWKEDW